MIDVFATTAEAVATRRKKPAEGSCSDVADSDGVLGHEVIVILW